MKIERFEDIDAWQLARELTREVYGLTKKTKFTHDFGLKKQIQDAAGSPMHNIAEEFDSETNPEFIRFLRYAKSSCTEVQSELYVALDQQYITNTEFQDVYNPMLDAPELLSEVSSSTSWPTSKVNEITVTLNPAFSGKPLNPEPLNL